MWAVLSASTAADASHSYKLKSNYKHFRGHKIVHGQGLLPRPIRHSLCPLLPHQPRRQVSLYNMQYSRSIGQQTIEKYLPKPRQKEYSPRHSGKIIAKKDIRAQIRRKLQTKLIGNASGLSTEEGDSSSDGQTRSLSAITATTPAEIDASPIPLM
jgi:hypothetical protein